MFIDKDERLSRASPPRRGGWTPPRRKPPHDWRRPVRWLVYVLLGLLAGSAVLATVGLLAGRGPQVPVLEANLNAPGAASPAAPPATVEPERVAPAAPPSPPPPAASEAPSGSNAEMAAMRAQLREATATLAALRAQAEQARQQLAAATRARQTALAEQQRQAQAEQSAASEDSRQLAAQAEVDSARNAAQAQARQAQALQDQQQASAAWTATEKLVRTLSRRTGQPAAPPEPPAVTPGRSPPPGYLAAPGDAPSASPAPASPAPATIGPQAAARAPAAAFPPQDPAGSTPATRPRVVLYYRSGADQGAELARQVAQRLLFSDFAYADTKPATDGPALPTVRYFRPEDNAAANRLAAMLAGSGRFFQVQDFSDHPDRAPPGTLDVWLGP